MYTFCPFISITEKCFRGVDLNGTQWAVLAHWSLLQVSFLGRKSNLSTHRASPSSQLLHFWRTLQFSSLQFCLRERANLSHLTLHLESTSCFSYVLNPGFSGRSPLLDWMLSAGRKQRLSCFWVVSVFQEQRGAESECLMGVWGKLVDEAREQRGWWTTPLPVASLWPHCLELSACFGARSSEQGQWGPTEQEAGSVSSPEAVGPDAQQSAPQNVLERTRIPSHRLWPWVTLGKFSLLEHRKNTYQTNPGD